MARVLFSNPPWWDERIETAGGAYWRAGVRAGSRWPFTRPSRSTPDRFVWGEYLPYPFFMGYAAAYVRKMTGATVDFRDSIAVRESYESYLLAVAAGTSTLSSSKAPRPVGSMIPS